MKVGTIPERIRKGSQIHIATCVLIQVRIGLDGKYERARHFAGRMKRVFIALEFFPRCIAVDDSIVVTLVFGER
jgi:hypothetical protein